MHSWPGFKYDRLSVCGFSWTGSGFALRDSMVGGGEVWERGVLPPDNSEGFHVEYFVPRRDQGDANWEQNFICTYLPREVEGENSRQIDLFLARCALPVTRVTDI